jgi:hypothetical protein
MPKVLSPSGLEHVKEQRKMNVKKIATTYLKETTTNWLEEMPVRRTRNPLCHSLQSSKNKISELLINDQTYEPTRQPDQLTNLPKVRTTQVEARKPEKIG